MSSLTNANTLSSAFIDLATYGELESRLYGNSPKTADNFLTYTYESGTRRPEKFKFQQNKEKLKNSIFFITAMGFILNYAYKYNLTYFEPCDLLQRLFLISAIISVYYIFI